MQTTSNNKIDILLSTYNGEKYLNELIQSLLSQTYSDWHLLIRDDGSTDTTLSIVADYCVRYPQKVMLIHDEAGNLGVTRSFEKLLQISEAAYIMFCDQDDVWLPEKIALTLQKMDELEHIYGNIPLLVHTNLCVVDNRRCVIADSFWQYANMHPKLIESDIHYLAICNCITGCTAMINQEAKMCSLPFVEPVEMHDIWIALHTMKFGKIAYIPQATIEYRQHTGNLYGAKPAYFSIWNKLTHLSQWWDENRQKYHYYHPLVYKGIGQYIYYKIKYFILVHFILKK